VGAEASGLNRGSDVVEVEAFRNSDGARVDVSACDALIDGERRSWISETVLTCLEIAALPYAKN